MNAAAEKLGGELEILSYRDCQVVRHLRGAGAPGGGGAEVPPEDRLLPVSHQPELPQGRRGPPRPHGHGDDRALGAALRAFRGPEGSEGRAVERRAPPVLHGAPHRTPTLLNDVSNYMDEWQSIASCHTSQLSLRDGKVLQNLRRFREAYGNILGVECAEAFVVRGADRLRPGTVP